MQAEKNHRANKQHKHHGQNHCNVVRPHQFRTRFGAERSPAASIHQDRNPQSEIGGQLFRQFPEVISLRLVSSFKDRVRFACRQRAKSDRLFQVFGKLLHGFGPKAHRRFTFENGPFQGA
jgi:hypothetical protein